jgi:hypothetical protein
MDSLPALPHCSNDRVSFSLQLDCKHAGSFSDSLFLSYLADFIMGKDNSNHENKLFSYHWDC